MCYPWGIKFYIWQIVYIDIFKIWWQESEFSASIWLRVDNHVVWNLDCQIHEVFYSHHEALSPL